MAHVDLQRGRYGFAIDGRRQGAPIAADHLAHRLAQVHADHSVHDFSRRVGSPVDAILSPSAGRSGPDENFQRLRPVLDVGNLLAPCGLGNVLVFGEVFPHSQMGHEAVRSGSMPVPFARRCVDGVAGTHLDDVTAA